MKNSIKSLKFIYFLAKYNSDNYPKVDIENDSYVGLDNNPVPLKILSRPNKKDTTSVIIIPGASPDAEEHTGMLFLGSIICKLGYKVLIPRIPPLKELKLKPNFKIRFSLLQKIFFSVHLFSSKILLKLLFNSEAVSQKMNLPPFFVKFLANKISIGSFI